jgi:hypothetical protein
LAIYWVIAALNVALKTTDLRRMEELRDAQVPDTLKRAMIVMDHDPCANVSVFTDFSVQTRPRSHKLNGMADIDRELVLGLSSNNQMYDRAEDIRHDSPVRRQGQSRERHRVLQMQLGQVCPPVSVGEGLELKPGSKRTRRRSCESGL